MIAGEWTCLVCLCFGELNWFHCLRVLSQNLQGLYMYVLVRFVDKVDIRVLLRANFSVVGS